MRAMIRSSCSRTISSLADMLVHFISRAAILCCLAQMSGQSTQRRVDGSLADGEPKVGDSEPTYSRSLRPTQQTATSLRREARPPGLLPRERGTNPMLPYTCAHERAGVAKVRNLLTSIRDLRHSRARCKSGPDVSRSGTWVHESTTMTGRRVRQAGQARPQPNKLTSSKHVSTELARELPSRGAAVGATGSNQPASDIPRVAHLEQELEATREALQNAVRDLDIATETVEQQRARSNELRTILDSTDIATLVLDANLRILFFTPAAKSLFDVIASDIGRPLADLTAFFRRRRSPGGCGRGTGKRCADPT